MRNPDFTILSDENKAREFVRALEQQTTDPVEFEEFDTTLPDNSAECWICAGPLEVVPPKLSGKFAAICTKCGLIQVRDLKIENEQQEVPPLQNSKAFSSITLQASRVAKYIDNIAEEIDLSSVRRSIDVGCDQGLLSHLLKIKYPQMECCGLDPNAEAIEFGRNAYPDTHLIAGAVEDYEHTGELFDLVIFTASIYRVKKPRDVMRKLFDILAPGGHFVINLNFHTRMLPRSRFDGPRDFSEALLEGDLRVLFSTELAEAFFSNYFSLLSSKDYPGGSYWREQLTRVIVGRKDEVSAPGDDLRLGGNTYPAVRKGYLSLFAREAVRALDQALEKTAERVVIIGVTVEAAYLAEALKTEGRDVVKVMHPLAHAHRDARVAGMPISYFDYEILISENVDALIVADLALKRDYASLIEGFYKDFIRFPLFEMVLPSSNEKAPVFIKVGEDFFLNRKIFFRRPNVSSDKNTEIVDTLAPLPEALVATPQAALPPVHGALCGRLFRAIRRLLRP